jgi:hypothetical protein
MDRFTNLKQSKLKSQPILSNQHFLELAAREALAYQRARPRRLMRDVTAVLRGVSARLFRACGGSNLRLDRSSIRVGIRSTAER